LEAVTVVAFGVRRAFLVTRAEGVDKAGREAVGRK